MKTKEVENLPGVGKAIADKLAEKGYDDIKTLSATHPKELNQISGISDDMAKKIIEAARDTQGDDFVSGNEIWEKESQAKHITTGSKELDNLLGGGIRTGEITEVYGEFGSSKSQIAFQLCINIQQPVEKGGLGKKTIFIDSENTFSATRVKQMAEAAGLDPEKALKNVLVAKAHNTDHQEQLVTKAEQLIKKDKTIGLVIVDSLTSHYRSDFIGRGELAERQQKMNVHLFRLKRMAMIHEVTVYFTNQVMSTPDQFWGDPTKAVGGHIIGHAAHTRIYVRKGKKGSRVAKLMDSPCLPPGEAAFMITEKGIEDIE